MAEELKIRPFLIGVVDGGLTNEIIKLLENNLQGYPICTISLTNYYKDLSNEDPEKDNYIKPEAIDFDLLLSDLAKMRDNEACEIPIYDFKTKTRKKETKKIESCQIIIVEGLFCFYNHKVRNLMDLKIFIDTDNDIRLARTITKGIAGGKTDLLNIIQKFHKFVKPAYNTFISPTKKYADIILPNATGHNTAVQIITNYLKLLFDNILNNKNGSIFSFLNEIVDPKYIFFQDNLIVKNESPIIDFLKDVFEDFMNNTQDEEFIELIRKRLLMTILSLLIEHLRKNIKYSPDDLPKVDHLLFDSDNIENIDFEQCNTVIFFKASIMNENDIKVPEYIISKNKDCKMLICSIFLTPKFAHYLTSNQINSILFVTLYFSEFFVKYDKFIKKDETVYNEKELEKIFKELVQKSISTTS